MKAIITLEFVELKDDKNTAHPDRSFVRKQWCVSCPSLPFPFPFSSLSQLPTQHRYHPRLQPHHALRPPSLTDDVLIEFTDIHHEPRPPRRTQTVMTQSSHAPHELVTLQHLVLLTTKLPPDNYVLLAPSFRSLTYYLPILPTYLPSIILLDRHNTLIR